MRKTLCSLLLGASLLTGCSDSKLVTGEVTYGEATVVRKEYIAERSELGMVYDYFEGEFELGTVTTPENYTIVFKTPQREYTISGSDKKELYDQFKEGDKVYFGLQTDVLVHYKNGREVLRENLEAKFVNAVPKTGLEKQ